MTRGNSRYAVACVVLAVAVFAQTQPATRSQVSGTVTNVGSGAPQLSLKSDQGADISVTLTDRTVILRIPPGEPDSVRPLKSPWPTHLLEKCREWSRCWDGLARRRHAPPE